MSPKTFGSIARRRVVRCAAVGDAGAGADAGAAPAVDYLFPDLGPTALVVDGKHFWFRPIIAIVADYTTFSQDAASLEQVGKQENTPELRAGRFGFTLRSKSSLKWEFYTTVDYQERRTREEAHFQLYDLQSAAPWPREGSRSASMKEMVAYELVGLSVLLPQQERVLLPFFPSRNIGVNFRARSPAAACTWSAGAFNDWLETGADFKSNARDFVGRVSTLAYESPDKTRYVHLGVRCSRRRTRRGHDALLRAPGNERHRQVRGHEGLSRERVPGELSLEALWDYGRFSVLTERFDVWVDAPDCGDPKLLRVLRGGIVDADRREPALRPSWRIRGRDPSDNVGLARSNWSRSSRASISRTARSTAACSTSGTTASTGGPRRNGSSASRTAMPISNGPGFRARPRCG